MIFLLHVEWPEITPNKRLLTYYVWRILWWPWRPFLGHQAWSWTTLRRGNVFITFTNVFLLLSRFTFVTFFYFYLNVFLLIWPKYVNENKLRKSTGSARKQTRSGANSQSYNRKYTSLCSAAYVRWQRGTARNRPPLLLSVDGTVIRTAGRTPDRYMDSAPHTILAASINSSRDS